MAKQYARDYEEHSSYGSAVRLIERADLSPGVVLDLGCGRSPVAGPLTELGFTYVGGDVDLDALADLRDRGFDAQELDLSASPTELRQRLEAMLGDRPLAAVFALDVIEHLLDPVGVLGALHELASAHPGAELIVSIPNITHVDIATKLLVGRWDMTDTGLLDDTHLQFFSPARLDGMLAGTGWAQVDTDDVQLPISDQCFPVDLPGLRRDAPVHDVLAWVRRTAGPDGETYQFVRRLQPVEPQPVTVPMAGDIERVVDEDRPPVTVVVAIAAGASPALGLALLGDLAAQTTDSPFEVVVVTSSPTFDEAVDKLFADRSSVTVERVEAEPDHDVLVAALTGARGRHVCVLGERTRVSPDWLAGVEQAAAARPAALVHLATRHAPAVDLGFWVERDFTTALADAAPPLDANWDLFHDAGLGTSAWASLAVPIESVQGAGLAPDAADDDLAWVAFALRVALMAGSVPAVTGTVLVADEDLVDLDAHWPRLAIALEPVPLMGSAGTVGRFGLIRSRLHHHRAVETELRGMLVDKDLELRALIHHTAELGREVDRLQADLARLDAWAQRRPVNLLKRLVRKLLRG